MPKCGLLGQKLGHSVSPPIHAEFADYAYSLYEKSEQEVADFVKNGDWDGLNVTIPYKKTVLPLCDELSSTAKAVGSVNTLVRRANGTVYGDNTDFYGFEKTLEKSGAAVCGQKTLVLGSGGAAAAVCAVLKKLGAETVVISRNGENNYQNIQRHFNAKYIINATPVGMFPNNGASPLDLTDFKQCECVFDLIYNPLKTALLLQAEKLGIKAVNGLYMLVQQAARSSEQFSGCPLNEKTIESAFLTIQSKMQNIVLIGMPGCGKTTLAALLSEKTGRAVLDTDEMIAQKIGQTPAQLITQKGEAAFRRIEAEIIAEAGKKTGVIIATGGGAVTVKENKNLLCQNGKIFWIWRDLNALATQNRPLSANQSLESLYEKRKNLYDRFCDVQVQNNGELAKTAQIILEMMK